MHAHLAPIPRDRLISELADRQHGVVSHEQLLALGLGRGAINARLAAGRLHPVFRGVYAVGRARLTGDGRWMAAVLACGKGAVLSHATAGARWGLLATTSDRTHVTVPGRGGRASRDRIVIHRPRLTPTAGEVTTLEAIPVTTPARTLLDLAATSRTRILVRAVERAEELRLFDLRAVEVVLEIHPTHRGTRRLRHAIADHEPVLTRSELERRFLELCRSQGLPRPEVNSVIAGAEVDFLWRSAGLVVETDGFAHHRSRRAFESDRIRDARLARAGLRVLRFSYRQVVDDPLSVAATVARARGGR